MRSQTKKPQWAAMLYWTLAGITSIGLGFSIATKTTMTISIFIAFLTLLIVKKNMLWGITAVIFLPIIGELYRLPFGQDNGTLISDVAIAVIAGVWILQKLNTKSKDKTAIHPLYKPFLFFCGTAIFSLVLSLTFLKPSEVVTGSLYLVRLIEYVFLGIITTETVEKSKNPQKSREIVFKTVVISTLLITIAGFIQLVVYPNLGKLEEYGWDPHQNRLVSTWLDPNFIAGLLGFTLAILSSITLHIKSAIKKCGIIIIIAILATGLFLTYSRSGYVGAATALIIIGLLKSRKLLIGSIIIFMVGLNFLPRAQERVEDLVHSFQSLVFNSNENPDPTTKLRIISWNQTLELIQKRPFLGSGYNTLKYVKYNEGFVQDTSIHSASGSDSSLLTILATTGLLGLIPFVLLYWNILKISLQNWKNKKLPNIWQGYGLGVLAGTLGLLAHSFFVNSLLFPQIMIFFWICVGLLTTKAELNPDLQRG